MIKFQCLMKLLFFAAMAGVCAPAISSAIPDTKPPAKKATAPKSSSKSAKATNSRPARKRKTARAAKPSYQLHPDSQRYSQIQHALADRGYFKGEPNGEWKDDSVDALRRFQSDQKLPDDGKISALSLTALGLGPRHDGTTASTVPVSSPEPPPPPPAESGAPPPP